MSRILLEGYSLEIEEEEEETRGTPFTDSVNY